MTASVAAEVNRTGITPAPPSAPATRQDTAVTTTAVPPSLLTRTWRDRLCARLGPLCALLRATHSARIPF